MKISKNGVRRLLVAAVLACVMLCLLCGCEQKPSIDKDKNFYTVEELADVNFICAVSTIEDSFKERTEIKGEDAVNLYNLMNRMSWKAPFAEDESEASQTESADSKQDTQAICLEFFIDDDTVESNCFCAVTISDAEQVIYTKTPYDTNLNILKAPAGTYASIAEYYAGIGAADE